MTQENPNAFQACNEANMNQTMGLTLRDYFAGQVLAGLHANPSSDGMSHERIVEYCYDNADAMLKARDSEKEGE